MWKSTRRASLTFTVRSEHQSVFRSPDAASSRYGAVSPLTATARLLRQQPVAAGCREDSDSRAYSARRIVMRATGLRQSYRAALRFPMP